jgi:hypothetical protein
VALAAALQNSAGEHCRAFCGSSSSRSSARERCRSVLWLLQQQKQRWGALQERPVALVAAEAAPGSVAGASCGSDRSRNSAQARCRNVLWLWQQKQRPGAIT